MDATSDSAIKLMLVLLFRQMLTGPVHFTVSADTAVMRIDRNRPGGDGQIGFLVIIACQNDVPGRVFRIAPCFEGNLRIIMHKRIRNRKALIDQELQGDLSCFIPADGLIIRQHTQETFILGFNTLNICADPGCGPLGFPKGLFHNLINLSLFFRGEFDDIFTRLPEHLPESFPLCRQNTQHKNQTQNGRQWFSEMIHRYIKRVQSAGRYFSATGAQP